MRGFPYYTLVEKDEFIVMARTGKVLTPDSRWIGITQNNNRQVALCPATPDQNIVFDADFDDSQGDIYCDGDALFYTEPGGACAKCGKHCHYSSVSFMAWYCSSDCLNAEWKGFAASSACASGTSLKSRFAEESSKTEVSDERAT